MAVKFSIAAFICILILPVFLPAQPAQMTGLGILLSVQEEADSASGLLENVIADSLALEFLINDFKVVFSETSVRETLLREAGEKDIPYILEGEYRVLEDQVFLQLECLRRADAELLYSGQNEYPVDLNLDNALQKQIRGVIALLQKDAAENPPFRTDEEPELDDEPAADEPVTEESEPPPFQSSPLDPSRNNLILAGEFGLFIPLGESADYFDLGTVPAISAVYPFSLPYGTLEVGASVSLNIISAQGELNSAQNLLFFLGPLAQYKIPLGGDVSAFFRLAAGGTLLMVNRNDEGYQGVLIPAFQTGIGGEYAFREHFGFRLGADVSLTFEESITITGIQPSIGVYYKL